MIKAKLFALGTERELLWTDLEYHRYLNNKTGRCSETPMGGLVTMAFASGYDDDRLQRWMTYSKKDEFCTLTPCKIVFYEDDFDGVVLFEYKYNDAALVYWKETFSSEGEEPMTVTMTISAAIQDVKWTTWVKPWQESWVPPSEQMPYQATETVENLKAKIVNGYWSYDKAGKEIYIFKNDKQTTIPLGTTIYFHVETENIKDNEEITLKLYEQDKNIFMRDFLDPDDDKFPEHQVVKKAKVYANKASVELVLQQSWEPMIVDDSDNAFSLDTRLELYWKVIYNDISKELPNKDKDYLRVSFSDRTLYFKTPTPNHNLPEFISYEGDPMLLVEFGKGFAKAEVKKKALAIATKKAEAKIKKIAFAKLKKGYMVDNTGKVYTGQRLIYEYKKMYSNSGELFENVQQGKNFGYNHGNGIHTTKGISQYDYFSKNGKRVTLLGMVKNIGNILDIFNLVKSAGEDLDTSQPLPLDFGPLSPIADLAGVLVQEQKAEMDALLEETIQLEVDQAKLQGLDATRKAINTWNHNQEYNWQLMAISNETANKLIKGEFRTFEELDEFSRDDVEDLGSFKVEMLYRETYNKNREESIFVIETLFINE